MFNSRSPIALITGASSGIGAAFARALARQGYQLLLCGRRQEQLSALCQQLGEGAHSFVGDLAEPAVVDELVSRMQALPRLDLLINNAGYALDGRFEQLPLDQLQAQLALHVQVTVRLCHAGLPQLLQHGGAIINVASVASWLPSPQTPLYGPTKAFVRSFSETLALAYRRHGVRVQALCPGFTVTDFHQRIGLDPQRFYRRYGLLRAYSAEQVVARSLADLAAGRIVSIPGWNYRLLVMLFRHAPMALVHWLLGRSTVARYGAD